jgi:hypothetical protein
MVLGKAFILRCENGVLFNPNPGNIPRLYTERVASAMATKHNNWVREYHIKERERHLAGKRWIPTFTLYGEKMRKGYGPQDVLLVELVPVVVVEATKR